MAIIRKKEGTPAGIVYSYLKAASGTIITIITPQYATHLPYQGWGLCALRETPR